MKDFTFDVEVSEGADATAFQHLPQQLMIRILGLTDDMQNCNLYCETISKQDVVPPYTQRLNVTQDYLTLPYMTVAPILSSSGEINTDALNQLLAQFNLKLK